MAAMLVQVLEKTISQNPDDQKRALEFLEQASTNDFCTFVKELSVVLRKTELQSHVRQAAGLQLKNVLCSKDDATKETYLQRWLQLPVDVRAHVKQQVTSTLGTESFRPSIAAQCVAAIACAEIPHALWPDIISGLMQFVTNSTSSEQLKEAALETLGYICQDIDPNVLERQANEILTAIVFGMKREQAIPVRLAATNALLNSLEFTTNNFSNEPERHIIMQVVCEATQCGDALVKVAALQCLVRIMSLYYQFMESYMSAALFPISVDAMRNKASDVALQGIEFWSNVCEEEIALGLEAEEAQENGRVPEHTSRHYAKGAVSHLSPILLETMADQDDADDDDDWTPSKAAGVCIMLLAQTVGNDVIDSVLPFLAHFASPRWQYREAAIMAFGSILDGPDPAKLVPLVEQALPPLVQAMSDSNVHVRDTAAWTIGRMCEICGEVVTRPQVLQTLLPAMSASLNQEPRVATNVCWAIVSLTKAAYEQAVALGTDSSGQPDTFVLSQCFEPMIAELIKTTDRADSNQSNLRLAAFETLMELIKNSPKDCYHVVQNTTLLMLKKLEQLLDMEAHATSASDKSQLMDLQALLCATLQSVVRKMQPGDAPKVADPMMNGLLQIMDRSAGRANNVIEEALVAVSTLVEALKTDFLRYVDALRPHLLRGLSTADDTAVAIAAVGVVTDLCRALEAGVTHILDDIMGAFINAVQNPRVNPEVKVAMLGAFGDVALAIGSQFVRYQGHVVDLLNNAANAAIVQDADNVDQVDYVDKLREQCINAYTGMLQGLRDDGDSADAMQRTRQSVMPFVRQMCGLINKCCDSTPVPASDSLLTVCAGLIGDLVNIFGNEIIQAFDMTKVSSLLARGRRSRASRIKTLANWATKEVRKVAPQALAMS
ncbi:hypothetical protein PMAYCL1PPCAC_26648 [Pristionchus mayeri]|uniref:Importin N-terminal domain-containing protein n=1 Tax=Pristionchus mayeri TaxID=1317129 RepID=A0AAN5D4L8_9BILA|nr:hypothetical protein PMAYCL1PPCAC_26648 [Pristionchus mayeri]